LERGVSPDGVDKGLPARSESIPLLPLAAQMLEKVKERAAHRDLRSQLDLAPDHQVFMDPLREMVEILRSEAGLFRKEPFLVENTLQESILDVLEVESQGAAEMLRREKDTKRFRELLEPHGIFVEITGKFRESPFCHDPRKVRYILRNLVSNAVKYRRERVNVSIRGDVNLLVSVEDDGRGIPKGEQEAVFERFVRLKDKEQPYMPGLGLGLSSVKALVEAMGGHYFITKRGGYRDTIFGRYSSPAITWSRRRSSRASTCATLDL